MRHWTEWKHTQKSCGTWLDLFSFGFCFCGFKLNSKINSVYRQFIVLAYKSSHEKCCHCITDYFMHLILFLKKLWHFGRILPLYYCQNSLRKHNKIQEKVTEMQIEMVNFPLLGCFGILGISYVPRDPKGKPFEKQCVCRKSPEYPVGPIWALQNPLESVCWLQRVPAIVPHAHFLKLKNH